MEKNERTAIKADPRDPEDFDVSGEGLAKGLAERDERRRARGRPPGTFTSNKTQVTLRLDRDALDRLRADGPGWQTRINDAVRKAAGL